MISKEGSQDSLERSLDGASGYPEQVEAARSLRLPADFKKDELLRRCVQ